jgi:hypothetical protein
MKGRKPVDITGRRFGRLVAVQRAGSRGVKSAWWCACECGRSAVVLYQSLRDGSTQSCGCLRAELARALGRRYSRKQPDGAEAGAGR